MQQKREMILDVNTDYFETHGGYEYAKRFYAEAYQFAVKVYGEDNILPAVMHADEVNLALSEQYGEPIYHYHMHIVALPVVEKQVLWTKRCLSPPTAFFKTNFSSICRRLIYRFSRGERGSTAENQSCLQYQINRDKRRQNSALIERSSPVCLYAPGIIAPILWAAVTAQRFFLRNFPEKGTEKSCKRPRIGHTYF